MMRPPTSASENRTYGGQNNWIESMLALFQQIRPEAAVRCAAAIRQQLGSNLKLLETAQLTCSVFSCAK
jgi:hypothetical protein